MTSTNARREQPADRTDMTPEEQADLLSSMLLTSTDARPEQPADPEDAPLTNLTPAEQADLQDLLDDEAARAAAADLPPVEVAASVITAESNVLDNVTSLTETYAPEIGPLTLKEAYGESIGQAMEWSADAQLCAAYSSGDDEDSYVDEDGLSACWSFTYRNSSAQYLDLIVVNGQLQVSDMTFTGTPGASFRLDDLLDSPEIVARALDRDSTMERMTLNLERDESGQLRALVISGDQQIVIDPSAIDTD